MLCKHFIIVRSFHRSVHASEEEKMMQTCLLQACDTHIDVCYLLYDMLSLLYVFYIELELSLSGGLKSIIIVKDSSIFMYVYKKLALPDSLGFFTNPVPLL